MKRLAIIGGGITGLAAAHRLLELSRRHNEAVEILLFEAGDRLGGIIQTEDRDGFLLERGPDAFITEKPEALELAQRLGLEANLIATNEKFRRSFIVRGGRLVAVPPGFHLLAPTQFWPFFNSRILSWTGKLRVAFDLLLPRANANGTDETLATFVRRRLGKEALERVAQPMVGGIYTGDPEKLSLRATMPRFLDVEQSHRSVIRGLKQRERNSAASGARYGLFLSFDRGMQTLVDRLAETLSCIDIKTNTPVTSVELDRQEPRWRLQLPGGKSMTTDALCISLPAYAAASLVRGTDALLANELDGIAYESTATVNLAYRRADVPHPLNGFGFVVPFVERRSLIACSFSSVKFTGRAPADHVLLRAFVGGALQPEMVLLDENEIEARVRTDLRELLGIEKTPLFVETSKWLRSMPQYELGHLDRVRRLANRLAALPGLALAGNAYAGVGIPDCIRSGEAAATALGKVVGWD